MEGVKVKEPKLDLNPEAAPEVGATNAEKEPTTSNAARTTKSPASRLDKYKQQVQEQQERKYMNVMEMH